MLPEQIVASKPALTVAVGLILNTIASLTALQVPTGSLVVNVSVTVVAVISAGEGV
ncbi:MAG: hypothetical protein M3Q95_11600 [Bacteroidota bacterium]|nr:hypothetical protein [Bacteroidota bacterium]